MGIQGGGAVPTSEAASARMFHGSAECERPYPWLMADDIAAWDAMDFALRAKLSAAQERYVQDPTPENYQAYQQALRAFADWTVRRKLPEDSR